MNRRAQLEEAYAVILALLHCRFISQDVRDAAENLRVRLKEEIAELSVAKMELASVPSRKTKAA